jgi:thermosome
MAGLGGVPVLILREGTRTEKGKEAIENNIMAARAVANAVRTTLGPKGMDKLLVDATGDVTITNDGVTILKEMEITHPAAKMVVEAAKTQDAEVGDGTTTAAVLTGELLKKAEELIAKGIHPTVIAEGYIRAKEQAILVLEGMAVSVTEKDKDSLEKAAITAMTGKLADTPDAKIAKYAVDLVVSVLEKTNGSNVDLDKVKVEKRVGESIEDSKIINGVIIDKTRVHQNMPKRIENAKIALLGVAIEMKDTETKAEISITSSNQFQAFAEHEKSAIKEVTDKVLASGANVVFCQKGIDDLAQHYLAKAGVLALRRVTKGDLEKLAKATGGNVVTSLEVLTSSDLGYADLVEEKTVGAGELTFVSGCKNKDYVSLLLRAGTKQVLDSLERALDDAMHVVATTLEHQKLVAGGGAPEVEMFLRLKEYAATMKGREQLAVEKFAESLSIIPKTLAENAGFKAIDKMAALKAEHEKGVIFAGLNGYTGEVVDMWKQGVLEPLRVKTQALQSATDAAILILRIDDVITSKKKEGPAGQMPPGMGMPGMGGMGMPGMGGMPGMM